MPQSLVVGRMYSTVRLTLGYTVVCDIPGCDQRQRQEWHLYGGQEVPWGMLPQGWHQVDGLAYCPAHVIRLTAVDAAHG